MKFSQKHPIFCATSPLLLFPVLIKPYLWINKTFLVKWLGCGCPQIDEAGNLYEPLFNANDFTTCFWFAICIISSLLAIFIAPRLFPESKRRRFIYIAIIFAISAGIAYILRQYMMWN